MPAEVEARIRQRLWREAGRQPSGPTRRLALRGSPAQVLLLLALMTVAGWVVAHNIVPVAKAIWERTHCAPTPAQIKR